MNIVENRSTFCCGFCLLDEMEILKKIEMKYVRWIILFIVFIGLVLYITNEETKEYDKQNQALKNGVVFEGLITGIKKSNNHSFGVLTLSVFKSNFKEFSEELKEGMYPYQIKDRKAEIYLPIYMERQIGDHVQLISDRQIIYYKGKNTEDKGEVYIITDPSDIDFVKKNSIFNNH